MINKLQLLNEEILKHNLNNKKEYDKHVMIKKILQEKDCFLKMSIEQAYAILRDLHIEEENLQKVYMNLV